MSIDLYTGFYKILLCLYPKPYRRDFGEEMVGVFGESLQDAGDDGPLAVTKLVLVELGGLLGNALRLRANTWRSTARLTATWDGPPTRREMLVSLAIFGLPAVSILLNLPLEVSSGGLAALLAGVFIAGLLRGFPRWSLPVLGLSLSAFSFMFLFQWAADLVTPAMLADLGLVTRDESARLVLHAFWAGLMWFSLFALTALVLGLLSLVNRFRALLSRVWQDWTLASYILYSGALFTLLLTFGQYRYEKTHALASTVCLATGALLYLCSNRPWQRTLSLLAGLTLAVYFAVTSQLLVEPGAGWKLWAGVQPLAHERWFEVRRALLEWSWMVLFLLAPALLKMLPSSSGRTSAST